MRCPREQDERRKERVEEKLVMEGPPPAIVGAPVFPRGSAL